jgi:prepilin-type N-terminal cleavage/methylation domain-containing protein
MTGSQRGVTLLEILISSLIVSVVVGGTMMAYLTALRIAREAIYFSEATAFAVQTFERFRSRMACDDAWLDPASCGAGVGLPVVWTADPLPGGAQGSKLPQGSRQYILAPGPDDFDGDGIRDYYQVMVKVSWVPPQ